MRDKRKGGLKLSLEKSYLIVVNRDIELDSSYVGQCWDRTASLEIKTRYFTHMRHLNGIKYNKEKEPTINQWMLLSHGGVLKRSEVGYRWERWGSWRSKKEKNSKIRTAWEPVDKRYWTLNLIVQVEIHARTGTFCL